MSFIKISLLNLALTLVFVLFALLLTWRNRLRLGKGIVVRNRIRHCPDPASFTIVHPGGRFTQLLEGLPNTGRHRRGRQAQRQGQGERAQPCCGLCDALCHAVIRFPSIARPGFYARLFSRP